MIAIEQLVSREHIDFMKCMGFTISRLSEYRPRFHKLAQREPSISLVVEKQKFGSGWRVGTMRGATTVWVAGCTPGVPMHKPGGSLIFDDPITAFVHAEVEEWGRPW